METVPSDLYPLLYTFFKEHGLDKTAKAFKKEVQVVREMVFRYHARVHWTTPS